jgi:stage II sporulation protein D
MSVTMHSAPYCQLFLLPFFLFFLPLHADLEIRVCVGESKNEARIQGKELSASDMSSDAVVFQGNDVSVMATGGALKINGISTRTNRIRITAKQPLNFDKRRYRDVLEVIASGDSGNQVKVIHPLSLEKYLIGIVASEAPRSFHSQALKAQAIAARTYALSQMLARENSDFHVKATVLDQVYAGLDNQHVEAEQAVKNTEGQVITFGAKPIIAYFHSQCGGHTEDIADVWGSKKSFLVGSNCPCEQKKKSDWLYRASRKEVSGLLYPLLGQSLTGLSVVSRSHNGRVKMLLLKGQGGKKMTISGEKLRATIGYFKIKSTLISDIEFGAHNVVIKGRGFGHGVGMCQWGANALATAGHDAEEIIRNYFKGTEIRRAY